MPEIGKLIRSEPSRALGLSLECVFLHLFHSRQAGFRQVGVN